MLLRSYFIFLIAALVVMAGCDTSEEEVSDSEVFFGSWQASSIVAGNLDILSLLGSMSATFPTRTTFRLLATGEDGDMLLDTSGSFVADNGVITFTSDDASKPVSMNYTFENNDNTVILTFPGSVLGELGFEIDPTVLAIIGNQTVTVTLTRQ